MALSSIGSSLGVTEAVGRPPTAALLQCLRTVADKLGEAAGLDVGAQQC